MAKKSLARQQRDAEAAAKTGKPGKAGRNAKPAPPDWNEAVAINEHIVHILDSVTPSVADAKTEVEQRGLGQFSPNPVVLKTAFENVETELNKLRGQAKDLREKIGDRKGKVTDPNAAMEVLDIYMQQQDIAGKLDTTFRPNLAILQEQVNQALHARAQATGAVPAEAVAG